MPSYARSIAPALAGILVIGLAQAQVLTVQVGTPPPPPTPLVSHGEIWAYHRGTNAAQANWQTIPDGSLNADWGTGPGGFGYGDAIATEATTLNNMRNVHTTVYIRRSFIVGSGIDTNRHLLLTMDYDDSFVAYLDGIEIRRENTTNGIGSVITHTQTGDNDHEASCCSSPNPPATYNLGAVSNRLSAGTHILAFVGLNDSIGSSDFHLIPDLALASAPGSGNVFNNGFYALATTNVVILSGTNTMPGASRVSVNGDDASFNPGNGTWTKTQTLKPGFNRLFITALDGSGNLLSNITQDVVYEVASVSVGGALVADTFWTNRNNVIRVTNDVMVPSGVTLTVGPEVVVILSPNAGITATTNGSISIIGAAGKRAYLLPATSAAWDSLLASGTNANLTLQHAEIVSGQLRGVNGGAVLVEDSVIRDLVSDSREMIACVNGGDLTVRRSFMTRFNEMDSRDTPVLFEDCLFEQFLIDGADLKGTNVPIVVRRTTLRDADPNNSNADGIDFGPGPGTVESALIHGFPDKGVSIGGASGTTIRNTLIYNCGIGISAYASSNCIFDKATISACLNGILFRDNPTPAIGAGTNMIVWGNTTNVAILGTSLLALDFSNVEGTNFPGAGNISADPLFVNAAAQNYRLDAGSPSQSSGLGGTNMGITWPVGGIPGTPASVAAISSGTNPVQVVWLDRSENENSFLIEHSTDTVNWTSTGVVAENVTSFTHLDGALGTKYYYRVTATNGSGQSFEGNIASAARQAPVIFIGGTISANTLWGSGVTVIVTSSVTVAASATLTIEACARIQFNQGLSLTVNGLLIAEGTPGCRIVFTRNTGATSWGTIDLFGAASTHRMRYADVDYSTGNIDATSTAILLQNIWWTNTTAQLVDCVSSSITLSDSYIPGGAGVEPVHFSSMPANGYALIKNNVFGPPQGYNDSVDFTGGNRPGPIVQFIDNVFLAAVDDCFDMDGTDAHIEGNIFLNVHQDAVRDSTANAVSTGADGGNRSELVVVRNIFYDCDHALLIKDLGSMVFENNTVVTIRTNPVSRTAAAYIQFGEPHRTVPGGRGILMNGNIMWDLRSTTPFTVFTNATMFMVANNNIIQGTNMAFGGNSTNDPMFVNWQSGITYLNIKSNLALLPGSPAIATGPNGLDRGALVPAGASISGEPTSTTTNTSATLTVAGPGIYAYRWKLNNGPWSAELSLTNDFLITATMFSNAAPITLTGLTNGTYTVSVIGKNSAGFWQDTNNPTVSQTWTVIGPADTDSDGMPDEWETANGLIVGVNDSADDADNDGMTNVSEYLAGTDPQLAASRLWLQSLPVPGNIAFSFEAVAGKSYTVQTRTSLSTGVWLHLANFQAAPTNRTVQVTNTVLDPARFYRVSTPIEP